MAFAWLKSLFVAKPPDVAPLPPPERLAPYARPCWRPVVVAQDSAPHDSKFSGAVAVLPGESWPACPHCHNPMQLFLQLNAKDLPPEAPAPWGEGLLQFFYCTDSTAPCEMACEAYAPFSRSTVLRVVDVAAASQVAAPPEGAYPPCCIVGWTQVVDYPHPEDQPSDAFTPDEQDALLGAGYSLPKDKLLGWPAWVQCAEYPRCPHCSTRMEFFFQIDSEDNVPHMFGDVGCGHLTYCPNHPRTFAFAWACC